MDDDESRIGQDQALIEKRRFDAVVPYGQADGGTSLLGQGQFGFSHKEVAVIVAGIEFFGRHFQLEQRPADAVTVGFETAHRLVVGEDLAAERKAVSVGIHSPNAQHGLLPVEPAPALRQELQVGRSLPRTLLVEGIAHPHVVVFVVVLDFVADERFHEVVFHGVAQFQVLVEHVFRLAVEHPVRIGAERGDASIEVVGNGEPAGKNTVPPFDFYAYAHLLRFLITAQHDIFLDHGGQQLHVDVVAHRKLRGAGGVLQIALEPHGVTHAVNLTVGLEIELFRGKKLHIPGKAIPALLARGRQSENQP